MPRAIKVLVISHLFPGNPVSENPGYGVFIRELLLEYPQLGKAVLMIPVDIIPGLQIPWQREGLRGVWNHLTDHLSRTLKQDTSVVCGEVDTRLVRFHSLPIKSMLPFFSGLNLSLCLIPRLLCLRRRFRFDLIHAHTALSDGLAAVLLGRLFGCPVVVTAHGSDVHSLGNSRLARKILLFVTRWARRMTCVSRDLKQRLESSGIPASKIAVINNGVSARFLDQPVPDVRKLLRIPADAPVIVSVTKLIEVKDPFTLVRAFKRVHRQIQQAHLVIVGGGDLEPALQEYLRRNSLHGNVHLIGFVPYESVPHYMAAADLFCLSSLREGFPTVLFEAMGWGNPVVATDVGGIPEAIPNTNYGLLVPAADPDALAAALTDTINRKWDRKQISAYARKHTWANVAESYFDLYRHVIDSGKSSLANNFRAPTP